ncbi:MAG: hypothetical protein GY708_08680 [Actinomycetia bacterium]|nr:hypothetical protein [Actinomycetes bacterium]
MKVESLEQIAERLGWSPERLQQARDCAAEPRPMNVTDRDHARAQALSNALKHTASALDEAS